MSSPRNSLSAPSRPRSERGSAIIAVIVFAAAIAVVSASFLTHTTAESRGATRTFLMSAALNLAEGGIDEAMQAVNNGTVGTADGWREASDNPASWVKVITGGAGSAYDLGQGTGSIYIRIDDWVPEGPTATVTAAGRIQSPMLGEISKQIVVRLRMRETSGLGVLTKNHIKLIGNVNVDAYDSRLGPYHPTNNRSDKVTVGTTSVEIESIVGIGSAQIYGFVATSGALPKLTGSSRIYSATTPPGVQMDPNNVRTDFSQNIPAPTAPAGTPNYIGGIGSSRVLPRVGDTPGPNGRYLYNATGIDLKSSDTLVIKGPVDIVVEGDVKVGGTAGIILGGAGAVNPSVALYCKDDVTLGGTGMVNLTGTPAMTTIIGLGAPGEQTITVSGTADYKGVINAPNASVTLSGNGGLYGMVVANDLLVSGSGGIHYDISLNTVPPSDAFYGSISWAELTDAAGSGNTFQRDRRDPFTFF